MSQKISKINLVPYTIDKFSSNQFFLEFLSILDFPQELEFFIYHKLSMNIICHIPIVPLKHWLNTADLSHFEKKLSYHGNYGYIIPFDDLNRNIDIKVFSY